VGSKSTIGLPKLLVLASLFTRDRLPRFNYDDVEAYEELQRGVTLPGHLTMTTEANYLMSIGQLEKDLPDRIWKLPTPPYVPLIFFSSDPRTADDYGTFGGFLMPNNSSPRQISLHILTMLDKHKDTVVCCFDYLPNLLQSTACPHVEDATTQFPNFQFEASTGNTFGSLARTLQFPPSTNNSSNPRITLPESTWTDGAYK